MKTLSDAVTIVEFLARRRNKTLTEEVIEGAIQEAEVPLHLREQVRKYFAPPLDIAPADLIVDSTIRLARCNPTDESPQQYFGGFSRFLVDSRGWPKSTVDTLADTSLKLIRRLPKPDAAPAFQGRGLVVGHIQSGKTANMAALIARAADEGYKLFIVLGGLWRDLRAQTQRRLDQEIAGASDIAADGPYVQHDYTLPRWARLTNSGLEGDFVPGTAMDLSAVTPKLAVIKKNRRIDTFRQWLERSPVPLSQLPAIVIDDEADQGSINTNYGRTDDDGEPIDPSATNRRIRQLLATLPKVVYIGFTATPFANILIDADIPADLYPRDFIATLPEPPGYFGPRKLFGLGLEPSDLSPSPTEDPPLDVIRPLNDDDLDELDRVIEQGGDCPRALQEALLAFILSSCARLARGQDRSHFSMLVHPSQRTHLHRVFAETIREELRLLTAAAIRPHKFSDVISRARKLWDDDFRKTTREANDPSLQNQEFDTIWKFAKSVVEAIEVKVLNVDSPDELDYTDPPKRYVVVGGNRLSRGLTLEGLSISFFTRPANQYDTLLQMGRWFGYRPQYHDLTRIYVQPALADRFAELARVEDELRNDLKKYAEEPDPPSPVELKPIIRRHPTMAVTAPMKMGAARKLAISFQNTIQQTVSFPVENKTTLRKNMEAARALFSHLGRPPKSISEDGMHIWLDVPADAILAFLRSYEFSRDARDVNRELLTGYIESQNGRGELVSWDVILPRGNPNLDPYTWAPGVFTRKIIRAPITATSIGVLSSRGDIAAWRREARRQANDPNRGGLLLYAIDRDSERANGAKFFTSQADAEDIVGLVFAFPESQSNATIEYISQ
ncbi:MAG TPA: Z1 domain-containing protein [Thermoanaerobaculia bacterium]|jgi:hypothetical protein